VAPSSLLLAAVLLFLNAFFVAAEFALVRVRATQLDALVEQGSSRARVARHIVSQMGVYLAVSQIGITIASLGLGWVGEPAMTALLEPVFKTVGMNDEKLVHTISTTLGFIIISALHIVIGEQVPKNYAIARAEGTSLWLAAPMRGFYILFFPALWLLNVTSNSILRLLGIASKEYSGVGQAVTADELYHITEQSAADGEIPENQRQLLTNVLEFSDHVVREIMVPRGRVKFLDADDTVEQALKLTVDSGHSRFPVVDGGSDNIVGVLHAKDLLPMMLAQKGLQTVRNLARPVIYVPENLPAQKLLFEFQRQRAHFALVIDEYGALSGIVTLEDALEELVGEIQDEFDHEVQPIAPMDNGGYSLDGGLLLQDLLNKLELDELETETDADTVGGYMMEKLQRIPKPGDAVDLHGWQLMVKSMDKLRIGNVEATPPPPIIEE